MEYNTQLSHQVQTERSFDFILGKDSTLTALHYCNDSEVLDSGRNHRDKTFPSYLSL